MKILVVCQYYYPEPFRISDICRELASRGHELTVITGVPNYPLGEIYDDYRGGKKRDELLNGVHVHRCFTIPRKKGVLFRFLNYYSFAASSTLYAKKLKEHFDVVFVNQLSPVMMACPAIAFKRKFKTPVVLYCLDLWPESLVSGGIRRGSFLYNIFHKLSGRIYAGADKILVSSKSFSDYFEKEFGISNSCYFPQYAEDIFDPAACRKLPDDSINLMFAGNLGAAQSLDTIIEAARLTSHETKIKWHILGSGSESQRLEEMAQGLENVVFHGRKPIEEMPKYYSMADAMLVTLQPDPVLSLTLPGKVQSYMAAGKPIIGAADGEIRSVIGQAHCGYCVAAGDSKALAAAALDFAYSGRHEEMACNSRKYYEEHFQKDTLLSKLESFLQNWQ